MAYALPLSKEDAAKIVDKKTRSYAGAFANAMINHPKMHRSKHPIQKFAAIGAQAEMLCNNHTPQSGGYDLLDEMIRLDAVNLTVGKNVVGVGTTHVAIEKLNFKRKINNIGVNYKIETGEIKLAKFTWSGGCGNGFPKFYPLYREKGGMLKESKIGNAHSYFTSMKKTFEIEIEKLKKDNKFFLCKDHSCYSCRMRWDISEKKLLKFYFHWFKKNIKDLSFKRIKNIYKSSVKK